MPLTHLYLTGTPVSDLTPLQGMTLSEVWLTPKNIRSGINEILRDDQLEDDRHRAERRRQICPRRILCKYDAGDFK